MSNATLSASIADASSRIQEKASDAFRAGRIATAEGLDTAASGINAGTDRVTDLAHSAADSLGASARYARKHGSRDMVHDVESLIKAHPGKALLTAVVLGFLAGRTFSRD